MSENLKAHIGALALSPVPTEITEKIKKTKAALTNCQSKRVPDVGEAERRCNGLGEPIGMFEDSAVLLRCTNSDCKHAWLLCCLDGCTKQVAPFDTKRKYRKHITNVHKKKTNQQMALTQASQQRHCDDPTPEIARPSDIAEDETISEFDNDLASVDDPLGPIESSDQQNLTVVFGQQSPEIEMLLTDCKDEGLDGLDLGFSSNSNGARYFLESFYAKSDKGGLHYLANLTLSNYSYHPTEGVTDELREDTALLQLRMAKLAFSLGKKHRGLIVQVVTEVFKLGVEGGCRVMSKGDLSGVDLDAMVEASRTTWNRIPRSLNDIRGQFLEGKNSIVANLPYPEIKTDIPGHSYALISDILRDFLGHHQNRTPALISDKLANPTTFDKVDHPSSSRRARWLILRWACAGKKALTCYVFWWSDDVEPNTMNKANRGSVWLLTMTIGTILEDGHNLNHTYPVAVGKKGDDHDVVFQKVEEEMTKLRKGQDFYVGSLKMKVPMRFLDFAHLGDQPERRGLNFISLGNRGGAERFAVSGGHREVYSKLRACPNCIMMNQKRLQSQDPKDITNPLPDCSKCLNWDILKKGSSLGLRELPDDYPPLPTTPGNTIYETSPACRIVREVVTNENDDGTPMEVRQMLAPFRVTHEGMKIAVTLAHEGYCNLQWSQAAVKSYLQVEGFNDAFYQRFMDYAIRCYALAETQRSVAAGYPQSASDRRILSHHEKKPELYQIVPFPPIWSRKECTLSEWPNPIMHLLFLGVVKSVMAKIHEWLKSKGMNASFRRKHQDNLNALVTMSVAWMNVLRYHGDKFGAWVSENYLSFCRLMPWFYQNIEESEAEPHVLPDENQTKKWSKKDNLHWLKIRGLETEGAADELRDRVAEERAKTPPPEILPLVSSPATLVQHVVESLYQLMECVMSTTVTEEVVMRTHYALRVFLSAYDALDASLPKKKNYIFSTYNFASLIDLPEMMQKYGPMRQLWEGNTRGEGFLRFAKQHMKGGLKQRWHYILLGDLFKAKAFDNILPQEQKQVSPVNSADALVDRSSQLHKYDSQYTLLSNMRETNVDLKQPISVFLVKDQDSLVKIYAVVGTYSGVIEIVMENAHDDEDELIERFGCCYYKFDATKDNDEVILWSKIAPTVTEIGYGMLLPLLNKTSGKEFCLHSLISSNWRMLNPRTRLEELIDVMSASFD